MTGIWTITNPGGGAPLTLAEAGVEIASGGFRLQTVSSMALVAVRGYDSGEPWWAEESVVLISRDGLPFFTGRVQESPVSATASSERRVLNLADGWMDLEEITYQEPWQFGRNTVLMPKAVLGLDPEGERISTGQQIAAVVDYAIQNGAAITKGSIHPGVLLWPSPVSNLSCADVILGELALNIDWVAWLDHSVSPPSFNAGPRSSLPLSAIDVSDGNVSNFTSSRLVRDKVRGVRIIYESAIQIDNEVFREGYLDAAGDTTGRKVIQAVVELEGISMQFQKTRLETLTIATNAEEAVSYLKKKFPALSDIPDSAINITKWERKLADDGTPPPSISSKARRISVDSVDDVPRELIRGSIEDWMRVKVRPVTITYDMSAGSGATPDQQDILRNFAGKGKTFTITATDGRSRRYKGQSQFTEGEGRPEGIAAAVFSAASADAYEGSVTFRTQEVSGEHWLGRTMTLIDGNGTIMPAEVIHSATLDIDAGQLTLECGPLPWLNVNDFYELQKRINQRPVVWWSKEERSSNTLGAEDSAGSRGDTVGGFDAPQTLTPPGGGTVTRPFEASAGDGEISLLGGFYRVGAGGEWVEIEDVEPTSGRFAYLKITQDESREVTEVVIEVSESTQNAVTIMGDPEQVVSRELLAEVVGDDLIQRRWGNFTLSLIQLDGDVVRWPEAAGGGVA